MNDESAKLRTAAKISMDLPCPKCGYNLRGLTLDRACPECGRSVEQMFATLSRTADRRHRVIRPISIGLLAVPSVQLLSAALFELAMRVTRTTSYDLEYPSGATAEALAEARNLLGDGLILAAGILVCAIVTAIFAIAAHDRRSALYCLIGLAMSLAYVPACLLCG